MSFGQQRRNLDYGSTAADSGDRRTADSNNISLYNQYSDNISCNIFSINNNVAALEEACKDIGSDDDCDSLRDKIHKVKQDTNAIVNTTMRFVRELKRLAQGREQRLQSDRLENEYRATVQRYDMMQKQLVPKMKQTMLPPKNRSQNIWGVVDEDEEKQSLMDAEKFEQQRQIQDELQFDQGLLVEREERVKQIETDILDVNAIFRELASMVHEQGEVIGTIEENVSHTAQEVESGTQQLSKASQYQSKYRKKLCWLILILLLVAGVITIVIYVSK